MKHLIFLITLLSGVSLAGISSLKPHLGAQGETRYILTFDHDEDFHSFMLADVQVENVYGEVNVLTILEGANEQSVEEIAEMLGARVERDQEMRLFYENHGEVDIDERIVPWGVERVGGTFDCRKDPVCKRKRAWVIDTGIDLDHKDLRVVAKLGFTAFDGGTPDDDHGHGTHVAGTIGARDNKRGVVGVASSVRLIPVKVLSAAGRGSTSGVIAGVNWVAKKGRKGDVANMSLGGGKSPSLDKAVRMAARRGIQFTLAAGNSARDVKHHSPARANGKNIFTVSAIDKEDHLASFSNYGMTVDIAEPGVKILSTLPGDKTGSMSGTSMAAPHAAGVLLKAGKFREGCEEIEGDKDEKPDCVGLLP